MNNKKEKKETKPNKQTWTMQDQNIGNDSVDVHN
jgi:hypothetical protein